jgi:hypothetical protein
MLAAPAAEAAGDCRRIPVETAACYFSGKPPACHTVPTAAQPCFTAPGRLSVYNGTPGIRLWLRGTKRLLGVVGGDGDAESDTLLPPRLRAAMMPTKPGPLLTVVGVFRVCPLATERAGWMRPVCIVSATQVVAIPDSYGPR